LTAGNRQLLRCRPCLPPLIWLRLPPRAGCSTPRRRPWPRNTFEPDPRRWPLTVFPLQPSRRSVAPPLRIQSSCAGRRGAFSAVPDAAGRSNGDPDLAPWPHCGRQAVPHPPPTRRSNSPRSRPASPVVLDAGPTSQSHAQTSTDGITKQPPTNGYWLDSRSGARDPARFLAAVFEHRPSTSYCSSTSTAAASRTCKPNPATTCHVRQPATRIALLGPLCVFPVLSPGRPANGQIDPQHGRPSTTCAPNTLHRPALWRPAFEWALCFPSGASPARPVSNARSIVNPRSEWTGTPEFPFFSRGAAGHPPARKQLQANDGSGSPPLKMSRPRGGEPDQVELSRPNMSPPSCVRRMNAIIRHDPSSARSKTACRPTSSATTIEKGHGSAAQRNLRRS